MAWKHKQEHLHACKYRYVWFQMNDFANTLTSIDTHTHVVCWNLTQLLEMLLHGRSRSHGSNRMAAEEARTHSRTALTDATGKMNNFYSLCTHAILLLYFRQSCFVKLLKLHSLWLASAVFRGCCLFLLFLSHFVLAMFVCVHLDCIVTVGVAFQLRMYCYVWDGERWVVAELTAVLNGNAGVWMETTAETLYTQFIVSPLLLLLLLELIHLQIDKEYIIFTVLLYMCKS